MNTEVVRVNGDLYAFIPIQDDWTGNYKTHIRKVRLSNSGNYVARADGRTYILNEEVKILRRYEDNYEMYRKWWKDTYRGNGWMG